MFDPESEAALGVLPGTTGNVDPLSAWPIAGDAGTASGSGTGRYGIGVQTSGGGGMGEALEAVWDWLNKPFTQPMSPTGIFLLVGSIIIAIIVWNMVLYHIRIAAETL